jgi:hypothetical protein
MKVLYPVQGTNLRPNPNDGNRYRMTFAEIGAITGRKREVRKEHPDGS